MSFSEIKTDNFRINNFDLIRLFAAFQVVLFHSSGLMGVYSHLKDNQAILVYLIDFLRPFPGVPIFFFTSGFLITRSFENNSRLHEYALNRVLRIYPALIVCVSVSILSVAVTGYFKSIEVSIGEMLMWFFARTTIFQFYNPEFMRNYGVGVLNGSLWTICVELQFYILVPLTYAILKIKKKITNANVKLLILITFFLVFNRIFVHFAPEYQHHNVYKLVGVSFIPWFYMFLVGMFFQRNFEFFFKLVAGKFIWLFIGYYIAAVILKEKFKFVYFNEISPVLFVTMALLVFSAAFSWRNLSGVLLRHNDISYGVYLYHMPVVNFFIYYGFIVYFKYNLLVILVTFCIAFISWKIIEKPALSLKKHPLNPLNRPRK